MKNTAFNKTALLFLLLSTVLNAQQGSFNFSDYWQKFTSTSNTAFSPNNFNSWELFGFSAMTAVFLLGMDSEMHEEYGLEKERGPLGLFTKMSTMGKYYDYPGTAYFTLGLVGSLYGTGKLINDSKMVETTHMMIQSFIYSSLITTALKVVIGRGRPYVENEQLNFRPFNFDSRFMSMPSGHTSSIFALMTVLAKRYNSWYVSIPAYTFATAVGFQRMTDKQHWPSDIFIGGVLGYLIADVIVRKQSFLNKLSVQPLINASGLGLSITF